MAYIGRDNWSGTLARELDIDHTVAILASLDGFPWLGNPDIDGGSNHTYVAFIPLAGLASEDLADPEFAKIIGNDYGTGALTFAPGGRDINGTGKAVYPAGTRVEIRSNLRALQDIASDAVAAGQQAGHAGEYVTRQGLQTAIAAEQSTRQGADQAERQAREAADTALGARIDGLPSGGGGGLSQAQVDARVQALAPGIADNRITAEVADAAHEGNTDRWGKAKLPADTVYGDVDLPDLIRENGSADVSIQQPAVALTWSAYAEIWSKTIADAGRYLGLAALRNDVTRPATDGGSRVWIDYRFVRRRGAADTVLYRDRTYPRNTLAAEIATEEKAIPVIFDAAANDTIRIEARIICQLAYSAGANSPEDVTWAAADQTVYLQRLVGGAAVGGGGGAERTEDQIRAITDDQLAAADSTKAVRPAQIEFLKNVATHELWAQIKGGAVRSLSLGGSTLTVTGVDGTVSTLELPSGGSGSSAPAHGGHSAGGTETLQDDADANAIVTPGRYRHDNSHWTGSNIPSEATPDFILDVTAVAAESGVRDAGIEQSLRSVDDPFAKWRRQTPAGDGTVTDLPTEITTPWIEADLLDSYDLPEGSGALQIYGRQEAESDAGRADRRIRFAVANASGTRVAHVARPAQFLYWMTNDGVTPGRLWGGWSTSGIGARTIAAMWVDGARYLTPGSTASGVSTAETRIAGLLSAEDDEILFNLEFSDGTFLYPSGASTDPKPRKVSQAAAKTWLGLPTRYGRVIGYGAEPPASTEGYRADDLFATPRGFFGVNPGGAEQTHSSSYALGSFAPARSGAGAQTAWGFATMYSVVNATVTEATFAADFGARPAGWPDWIIAFFWLRGRTYFVASRDIGTPTFVYDYKVGGDWASFELQQRESRLVWAGTAESEGDLNPFNQGTVTQSALESPVAVWARADPHWEKKIAVPIPSAWVKTIQGQFDSEEVIGALTQILRDADGVTPTIKADTAANKAAIASLEASAGSAVQSTGANRVGAIVVLTQAAYAALAAKDANTLYIQT